MTDETMTCEHGEITGQRCDGHATERARYVPEHQRGTARAAGSPRGMWVELRLCADCYAAWENGEHAEAL